MKILFMGTPDIAAESLCEIISNGHEVCGVFTREDKPVGRKQVLTPPPVKLLAQKHNLPIFQPKSLKTQEAQAQIKELSPDIIVVVAYGRILPKNILELPKFGCINLHVSLLPKYRGSAPIQWAVINGDKETGVTVMHMDEGIDTGDIISTCKISIGENETSGELFERVSSIGAKELCAALEAIKNGTVTRTPQNAADATSAPPLCKEQARFAFDKKCLEVHNLVRGLNPWPVAFFEYAGKKIKVLKTRPAANKGECHGKILCLNPLIVSFSDGALELCELVPEGSKPMNGGAWAAGKRFSVGDSLKN